MPLSASSAVTVRHVIDQSLAAPPAPHVGGATPTNFCTVWPEAKPILKALVAVVSAIPGLGQTAGPILTSLISVGESVYQQTCPASGGAAAAIAQNEVRALIDSSLGSASAPLGGAGPSANFCAIWPQAKPILQVLAGIVVFIPGAGAAAGPVLASLIAVGDSVFQQTCQSQPPAGAPAGVVLPAGAPAGVVPAAPLPAAPVPSWLAVMGGLDGTHWTGGPNVTIQSWLSFISSAYPNMAAYCASVMHLDYFEWCGLTVAYCMAKAGIAPVFGTVDTSQFLWAAAWLNWGMAPVGSPQPGDVVVFKWPQGGHHVTLFERDIGNGKWACHGGNQSHLVNIEPFPSSAVIGVRRPIVATV